MQVPRCCFYCCFYFLALVYRKVLICIHFVFVPVFVFMIPSTLNNEHLSSKSSQMHQLVSELKCSGKVLHHNWKYISTNKLSTGYLCPGPNWTLFLEMFQGVGIPQVWVTLLICKSKYIVVGCWSQPWCRTQTHCVWMQNTWLHKYTLLGDAGHTHWAQNNHIVFGCKIHNCTNT